MRLQKIYLRYYPPGLGLCYTKGKSEETKMIDLIELNALTDLEELAFKIEASEPLLGKSVHLQVLDALRKLQDRQKEPIKSKFYLYKTLVTHILPLTNISFDKQGQYCITGSYDRTCCVWNVDTGTEVSVLRGHENVVFSVGFNFPRCDRIVTGSFDKTSKIWNVPGNCLSTLYGHIAEVVASEFSPNSELVASCSMDGTARVFHAETAQETHLLKEHKAEVIAARFDKTGTLLLTGSFDETAIVWDLRAKEPALTLRGHEAELSNCIWNFTCTNVATGSLDKTARIWDLRNINYSYALIGHKDEVLDIAFDYPGNRLATASSDCTAKIWDLTSNFELLAIMAGHIDEVSKVMFSPSGGLLLTASADKTARIWNATSGICTQILSGHDAEVFSCQFSYIGDAIVTCSKDNTCKIWR
uniref:CSON001507 protein n=1 Tax=Culicoides sonorensis TaxID=179676 RepID=A0A336K8U9_CULSO